MVEKVHKEIRKNVIIYYSKNREHFNLKNALLDAVESHNNTIHTINNYRPKDIINNTNEEVYHTVLENIKNSQKFDIDKYNKIDKGIHILIKKNCTLKNNRLTTIKLNIRNITIAGIITDNQGHGLNSIKIDQNYGNFSKNDEIIAETNQLEIISEKEWTIIMRNLSHDINIIKKIKKNSKSKSRRSKKLSKIKKIRKNYYSFNYLVV